MRLIYLVSLIMLLTAQFQPAFGKGELQITGKINRLEVTEKQKMVKFYAVLTLTFTNNSETPILLFIPDSPLLTISREIYGSISDEKEEKKLFSLWTLPSMEKTDKWKNVKESLNLKTPPSKLIRKIEVGESITFEEKDWFYIDKKREIYDDNQSFLWNEIKDAKSLSLRLGYRIWSHNLEVFKGDETKLKFGEKLRKRWSKYGYLWLDDITSEPILLDLSSAVVKTSEN